MRVLVPLIGLLIGTGCRPTASSPPSTPPRAAAVTFQEAAAAWNVRFAYQNGSVADRFSILESLGGGVAILDYDQDGQSDLAFSGGGLFSGPRAVTPAALGLFRQTAPRTMAAVGEASRFGPARHYSHGMAAADPDNDGFADVLVTGFGGVQLLHNLGDGTWEDSTEAAGLADPEWSSSAAWGDINGDGALDLYAAHYVNWSFDNDPPCYNDRQQREVCSPLVFEGVTDRFWFSTGTGAFREATDEVGLSTGGKGVGVLIADLDLDGDVDVYVANDTTARFLYENRGGKLSEIGASSGADVSRQGEAEGSMGTDLGDFDLDGLPDLWVANFEQETFALLRNRGHLLFDHVSQETGVGALSREYVGWGVVFFDVDLDGDEDVFVSNGHVERNPLTAPARQRPILMVNSKGERFENRAAQAGEYFRESHPGRGAAKGDLDRDGDIDLVVSHINEPAALLVNESDRGGESLSVRLVGTESNRDAIGAIVRLTVGTTHQIRQRKGGGSYASTGDARLVFGVPAAALTSAGKESPPAAVLDIVWPSGRRESRKLERTAGRFIVVENGPMAAEVP